MRSLSRSRRMSPHTNTYLESGMKKCRNVGFQQACFLAHDESSCVSEGAPQRLCSTFHCGRPGIGLLLLRAAVGFAATAEGILYLAGPSNPSAGTWLLGLVLIAGGVALAAGFLTPFAALLVGLCFLGIAVAWFPAPSWDMHDARIVAFGCRAGITRAGSFFPRRPLVRTPRNCDSALLARIVILQVRVLFLRASPKTFLSITSPPTQSGIEAHTPTFEPVGFALCRAAR
jgi:uncharacterized membrane protein YphA (DoxX/SURF4 family)